MILWLYKNYGTMIMVVPEAPTAASAPFSDILAVYNAVPYQQTKRTQDKQRA